MKIIPLPSTNYIKHQECFYEIVRNVPEINAAHIALYHAIFRSWNVHRFANPISPSRDQVISLSGISSNTTYYKILRDLENFDLIRYYPSKSIYTKSYFCVSTFEYSENDILINVWALSNHADLNNQQLSFFEDLEPKTESNLKYKLINGKGALLTAKKYSLVSQAESKEKVEESTSNRLIGVLSTTDLQFGFQNINTKHSNSSHHVHSKYAKSANARLNPSGVPIDPSADYSIPL